MAKVIYFDGAPDTFVPDMTRIRLPEEEGRFDGPENPIPRVDLDAYLPVEATRAYIGALARALAEDPGCDDGRTIVRSNN